MQIYLPLVIFLIVGLLFGITPILLGHILSPSRPKASKLSAYECGFEPFENARVKFDVRFYLIAILFILFDLEIAFLFPFALNFKSLSPAAIYAMIFFLSLLLLGFLYEWKKGALEWE